MLVIVIAAPLSHSQYDPYSVIHGQTVTVTCIVTS